MVNILREMACKFLTSRLKSLTQIQTNLVMTNCDLLRSPRTLFVEFWKFILSLFYACSHVLLACLAWDRQVFFMFIKFGHHQKSRSSFSGHDRFELRRSSYLVCMQLVEVTPKIVTASSNWICTGCESTTLCLEKREIVFLPNHRKADKSPKIVEPASFIEQKQTPPFLWGNTEDTQEQRNSCWECRKLQRMYLLLCRFSWLANPKRFVSKWKEGTRWTR